MIAVFLSTRGCFPVEGEVFLYADSWTLFNKHKTLILYLDGLLQMEGAVLP